MGVEIERKFLVADRNITRSLIGNEIHQGYMFVDAGLVRIRTWNDDAFITLKGKGMRKRLEFEYAIPHADALIMLRTFCSSRTIYKHRYLLDHQHHVWEIDVFHDENEGLFMAEIELESETETFALPPWLGQEVTGDPRYYNSNLIKNPFTRWGENEPFSKQ